MPFRRVWRGKVESDVWVAGVIGFAVGELIFRFVLNYVVIKNVLYTRSEFSSMWSLGLGPHCKEV